MSCLSPRCSHCRPGGPLVRAGPHSSADKLVGLVSWGFGCADPNFPGVYTRISAYYEEFLKPNICEYSRSPPSYLNCDDSGDTGPPTAAPVAIPEGLLSIFIDPDPFSPEDLGWELSAVHGESARLPRSAPSRRRLLTTLGTHDARD